MHLVIENNRLEEIVVDQNKRPDASKGKKKIRKYSLCFPVACRRLIVHVRSSQGRCRRVQESAGRFLHARSLARSSADGIRASNAVSSCILETTPGGGHACGLNPIESS
jgi:hypothetical protein